MYENLCYQKPVLSEAIARIDFVAPLDILEKSLPPKLAKVVSSHFPISEPTETIAQELQFTPDGLSHRQSRVKHWNYFGKNREKQITIASPYLFVSYKLYTTYDDMMASFSAVLDAMRKACPDAKAGRFGLRYINNIEAEDLPTPTTWDKYITQTLLGAKSFFGETAQLTRLFHAAEISQDDLNVRFQFGMPNPDYPAVIKRPLFILDFDAYVQTAHELDESLEYMDKAHAIIQDMFERSITDALRSRMNAKHSTAV